MAVRTEIFVFIANLPNSDVKLVKTYNEL